MKKKCFTFLLYLHYTLQPTPIDLSDGKSTIHNRNEFTVESLTDNKTSTLHEVLSVEKLVMHLPLDLQVDNEKRVYNIDFDASVHSPWAVAEAVCLNNHAELKLRTVSDIVNGCIPSIQSFIESAVRLRLKEIQENSNSMEESTVDSESNETAQKEPFESNDTSLEEALESNETAQKEPYESNETSQEESNETSQETLEFVEKHQNQTIMHSSVQSVKKWCTLMKPY